MSWEGKTNQVPTTLRIAVIGGGISGLAATHRLIELADKVTGALDVTLFEAGSRLGGVIQTERIGDSIVELGADSFLTNKPAAVELCRRIGIGEHLIGTDPRYRQALVLRNGRPVPVPDGFMLMAPARFWPIVTSPIFSPLGKLRMGLECLIPRRKEIADESVASFVRRRFGSEALDRLVQPLVAGIYTANPERLSLQATLPRFIEMERRYGSLVRAARRQFRDAEGDGDGNGTVPESGARYGLFASLRDGLSQLVRALVLRIEQAGTTRVNTPIVEIQSRSERANCFALTIGKSAAPDEVPVFDAVILALPAHRAARLVAPLDGPLSAALDEIEYASSAIVATGHAAADVIHPLNGSGLVVPAAEKRDVLSVSFASRKFAGRAPEGKVVLRTFLGGALKPEALSDSDEVIVRTALVELRDLLGVGGIPDFAIVSRHLRSMPQYHVGHVERVQKIMRLLDAHPRLALAGNAYNGVGIPDCIQSGEQAAERVIERCFAAPLFGPR